MAAKMMSMLCTKSELKLDMTLACGQSFRWSEHKPGEWTGVLAGKVWILSQDDNNLCYKTYCKTDEVDNVPTEDKKNIVGLKKTATEIMLTESKVKTADHKSRTKNLKNLTEPFSEKDNILKDDADILRDYFQLNINLEELYKLWSNSDANFKSVAHTFSGIRMLRQDPVENLFSFICSSNNHISRISQMVEKLCTNYGEKIVELEGKSYHAFPTIKSLSGGSVEEELRALGFGYRAKYISLTARYIVENHSDDWLHLLRETSYKESKAALMKLCGVGAKVADCVCLMSLDKTEAVPVDTHVWQIAARDYMPKLKQSKSLTDKLYEEIGDCFRNLWGPYAGWAHSVLFTADLKQFKKTDSKVLKVTSKRKSEVGESCKTKTRKTKK